MERIPVTCISCGLDMSLSATGFCLKDGSSISVETIKTNPRSAPNDLARLKLIVSEVMSRIPLNVTMVCIEDYFMPSNRMQIGAAIKLVALGTLMRMALYDAGFPFYVVIPSQAKKFVTGKGTGQKSIIVREVYRKWAVEAKDDNQADSCVLAHMAEVIACSVDPDSSLVLPYEMAKYQLDTIKKVVKERPHYNIKEENNG